MSVSAIVKSVHEAEPAAREKAERATVTSAVRTAALATQDLQHGFFPPALLYAPGKQYLISKHLCSEKGEKTQTFTIVVRDVLEVEAVKHTSAKAGRKWLAGPNFALWPQQLNFAVL